MAMEQQASLLKSLINRPQEYLVGFGVVMVLAVMVMPIPPFLLDLLLSFSITFALIILLVSVFMRGPLDFSVVYLHWAFKTHPQVRNRIDVLPRSVVPFL